MKVLRPRVFMGSSLNRGFTTSSRTGTSCQDHNKGLKGVTTKGVYLARSLKDTDLTHTYDTHTHTHTNPSHLPPSLP